MLGAVEGLHDGIDKLKFRLVWTAVALAGIVVLAAVFWRALLGLAFLAIVLFAIWHTRERMSWVQTLLALGALTIFALIFWRGWLIVAMVAAIAALVALAMRRSRVAES